MIRIKSWIRQILARMRDDKLSLNDGKTEFLIIGT